MPVITIPIEPTGCIIEVYVGVSHTRRAQLEAENKPVPAPTRVRALIDSGASESCVDPIVVQGLGIPPHGSVEIFTPSTGSNPATCLAYDVSIVLHQQVSFTFPNLLVTESSLFSSQGIHALLGRDILTDCLFVYNGHINAYTLAF